MRLVKRAVILSAMCKLQNVSNSRGNMTVEISQNRWECLKRSQGTISRRNVSSQKRGNIFERRKTVAFIFCFSCVQQSGMEARSTPLEIVSGKKGEDIKLISISESRSEPRPTGPS